MKVITSLLLLSTFLSVSAQSNSSKTINNPSVPGVVYNLTDNELIFRMLIIKAIKESNAHYLNSMYYENQKKDSTYRVSSMQYGYQVGSTEITKDIPAFHSFEHIPKKHTPIVKLKVNYNMPKNDGIHYHCLTYYTSIDGIFYLVDPVYKKQK